MQTGIARNGDAYSLTIDGTASAPVILRSFRSRGDVVKSFYDHGFRFFNMFPSGIINLMGVPYSQFGEVWIGENNYDWDALRRQVDLFLENSPDGYLSVMAQLDTRDWFLKEHPGCADSFTQLIQTVGWKVWQDSAARWLCALIDKMEEWMPGRIYGVFLMAGGTTEWYTRFADDSPYIGHYDGVPNQMQTDIYRQWVGDPSAVIPSKEALHAPVKGCLSDPSAQKEEQRYWHFYNEIVADTICHFAAIAKEHMQGRLLVGSFYGYLTGVNFPCVRECNYLGIEKVLHDKNIDVLFCPTSYTLRDMSCTSGFRVPIDTFCLHRKLYYMEIDCRTYVCLNNKLAQQHAVDNTHFQTLEETQNYICREAGMVTAKGQSYWWFDMYGGYYQDEPLMDVLETLRKVNKKVYDYGAPQCSEVALMLDVNSMYVINGDYPMGEPQLEQMTRSGVPWAEYTTDDLLHEDFPFDRIKVFVFANLFYPTDAVRAAVERLRRMGKTLIFLHAPGYVTENGYSEESMKELTGFSLTEVPGEDGTVSVDGTDFCYNFRSRGSDRDMVVKDGDEDMFGPYFTTEDPSVQVLGHYRKSGKPALFRKNNAYGGVEVYSAAAPIPESVLRPLYREAGVFNYWDSTETLYLNKKFICLNSYKGGPHTFYWPQKETFRDVFTGEVMELGPEGTTIDFTPWQTRLLLPKE